ncbi:Regulator of nonsense transcripts like [Actinidia chinensis var. chinensis]|uniref:Regulator of nonsense transcripts like n=1 Tax=Actinidia chinensis var. chinensis TaxID=1590841 RepID=A0A2R6RGG7_ACTCC|nr:Regulator of nonsense transcripts like [Actinidia chinensis var. chinensis]
MKGPLDRTKVVVRHLPPTISQSALAEQIDGRFAGRYNSVFFLPGKSSPKRQSYARVYLDFKRPEDVIEFAEFFDGHVFVNEKGTQFRTIVEYAPSQRVPKHWSKKDGREGTIFKDPDYMEFLEFLAKPVENLPSAEIQLERREAERAGAAKDAPIITPLMDFVRQKRATKGGNRRSLSNGKPTRKVHGGMYGSPSSASSRRGSDRKRISTSMYVLRDTAKNTSGKDKSTYTAVPNRHHHQLSDKSLALAAASGTEVSEEENGIYGSTDNGKKKILLLKGKVKEIPHVSGGMPLQQNAKSFKNSPGSSASKQNQRHEASGRVIKSILLNKDARHSQSSSVVHSDQHSQSSNLEKDRRPPRPQIQMFLKDANGGPEYKVVGNDLHGFSSEKQEKRTRNKDRPDRGVWTPLRYSDGSHASDESLSSSACQSTQLQPDSVEGSHGEGKIDMSDARSGVTRTVGSGRSSSSYPPLDNGSHKHSGRRGLVHNVKDDGSSIISDGKLLKRGGSSGYVPHEKQVWVQKSSTGS